MGRRGGHCYYELGSPLTCLLAPDITGLQPYGVEGVGRAGSQVPLPPAGWLIKSVRTRPAPAAAWLSRGVIVPKVRLPTAVPFIVSPRKGISW
jgi:hypothetical protein